ncbi:MAG: PP2C family serine/threonine-protein phosphatase [Polyangiaceae bacterium]|nr:PP2C family serine/threonine-protein phosphatase [Polyangiaceae bacterium]
MTEAPQISTLPTGSTIRLRLFGRTDVGQIREHNEDNFVVADLTRQRRGIREEDREQVVGPRGTVLGVCDGMGGAAAGEVASQLAVDIIYESLLTGGAPTDQDSLARRLVRAVEAAGAAIFNEARADRTRRGMGTTATIAALLNSRLFVAQVGDSRAYILRNGRLVQVSRDQSLANQLIEAGQLTEEEAETFEHNNIILQALGTAETVQVDLTYVDLCQGDVLMVCSDGLSGMLRADEMREVLCMLPDPQAACKELIDRANLAGGHDNVTVIVAHFDGEGLRPPSDADELKYKKYALPGEPVVEPPSPGVLAVEPSELQAKAVASTSPGEPRLRVGQTLIALASPFADTRAAGSLPPGTGASGPSTVPPAATLQEDPVDIPTTGLHPKVVGMLMLGAILMVAVAGFMFFR